ncbi:hypothetical protein BBK36DRAFT_1155957 [Trichoderma citrinoviride]|uniref:Ribosomal RNA methyltransferase FtsJ domain-containing protein n=1 Tax=Trichoderma citrinoviride TaxID=58853 RepID=A0A2T4BJ98_9HYPO|nr:hypothetical protein BBK36DRAFT_1155957 [Trichoderma citrinoviride]PTB69380.1 hypothetical protein BBK36DRAFT_1155957 [Trichoderma citrinoviride]
MSSEPEPSTDTPSVPSSLARATRLCPDASGQSGRVLKAYLLQNAPEYRVLDALRQKGWENKAGDTFFAKQRQQADHADEKTVRFFYNMMKGIASEINRATGALRVHVKWPGRARILDFCAAPGGFLETAMGMNRGAEATGFSLPPTHGGHEIIMPLGPAVTFQYADVTMFAADMGFTDIPQDNPEAESFELVPHIQDGQRFHLVFCDGQVLRTHVRAAYREHWEARRLAATQLAIGLEHVSLGGTMVVLLHKLDAADTVGLIYTFSRFSTIQLFKPTRAHAKRSSFYMVATNIQSNSPLAREAVESWKQMWRVMTFGSDEERKNKVAEDHMDEQMLVEQFGPQLVRLGREIWDIQARALEKAPFMQAGQNGHRTTG